MTIWTKIKDTKFRYVVIILLLLALCSIFYTLMFNGIPKDNRDAIMIIVGVITGGFTMGMQHTMKTPDKEKTKDDIKM